MRIGPPNQRKLFRNPRCSPCGSGIRRRVSNLRRGSAAAGRDRSIDPKHEVAILVGQRVFGIALGYEDLKDRDELRHDPMMAILMGKLTARREDCAPVAGKSTLMAGAE
jgi:Transposase DDE domain group 1